MPKDRYRSSDHEDDIPYMAPDDPMAVVMRTRHELERAKEQGVFGIMRMRWEAWIEEKLSDPIVRKMRTQEKLLEAHRSGIETQAKLVNQNEVAKRQLEEHRREATDARRGRLLAEAALSPAALESASASSALPQSGPPLRPYLTDAQIEAVARRFVDNAKRDGVYTSFDEAWAVFERESGVALTVPDHTLAEVREKACQLFNGGRW